MGSNFSKEGITKDLEAMKNAGIGGATIFNIASAVQETHFPTENNPWPGQTYRSSAYWDAVKHAAYESQRLGLEIGLHNTAGYSTTGGPWVTEERCMQKIVWSSISVDGGRQISLTLQKPELPEYKGWGNWGQKATYYKDIAVLAVPDTSVIAEAEIMALTSKMDPSGTISWTPPEGKWMIFRIGHSPTMANPHPLPDELIGKTLEVDKMSLEQNIFHWQTVIDPVVENLGKYIGKSFNHILIDSYEAGFQNWTPGFREEFMKLKGYDPVPWLVSFCLPVTDDRNSKYSRIVGSQEQTKRFEWDYYDVISQLYYRNGWETARKILHKANLELQFEPYGGPFSTVEGVAIADLPMGEFWAGGKGGINPVIPAAARAAGKKIVGAEAFTGRPEISKWTEDPASLKSSADGAFASGVNRLILHHWVHQPFNDKYQPALGMGWWGTHFSRHQTWFEPGKAFFSYLARCQAMLQYGEQVADWLSLDKQIAFSDVISKNDFLKSKIRIHKGKILLPSGRQYQAMIFDGKGEMLPEIAFKIRELVKKGATIISAQPETSPSLKGFPYCDDELKRIGEEVWGNAIENSFGKGHLFTNLDDAVDKLNIKPDYIVEHADFPSDIRVAHRVGAEADIYFVVNMSAKPQSLSLSFRISGKKPELWQAEDGSISLAPVWSQMEDRTVVDLRLKGTQSIFVVFREKSSGADHPVSLTVQDSLADWSVETNKAGSPVFLSSATTSALVKYASGKENIFLADSFPAIELNEEWFVTFYPRLQKPFELKFRKLTDFSIDSNKIVKYFSGTAIYRKSFIYSPDNIPETTRWMLSLGVVNDISEVIVNDRRAGVLWYPPFIVDITDLIVPGENRLEIKVTNNWANRLIGDEQEPADFEWGYDRGPDRGRAIKAYPDWFIKDEARPSAGRITFSLWNYYRQDSPLQAAGMVGPVKLVRKSELLLGTIPVN